MKDVHMKDIKESFRDNKNSEQGSDCGHEGGEKKESRFRTRVPKSDIDLHAWSSINQNLEDGKLEGEITDWEFESEAAVIHYRVTAFPEKEFSQKLDAQICENKNSQFEKFLLRYDKSRQQPMLKSTTIDLGIKREREGIQFRIITEPENNTVDKTTEMDRAWIEVGVGIIFSLIPMVNAMFFLNMIWEVWGGTWNDEYLMGKIAFLITFSVIHVAIAIDVILFLMI